MRPKTAFMCKRRSCAGSSGSKPSRLQSASRRRAAAAAGNNSLDEPVMPDMQLSAYGLDRPESGDDVVVPFALETLDSRGRVVRLGEALDAILNRHNYPPPVARLLGEAVVLAALIGS